MYHSILLLFSIIIDCIRRMSFYRNIMLSVSHLLRSIFWSLLFDLQHNSDVLSKFRSRSDAAFSVRHDFVAIMSVSVIVELL